MVGRGTTDPDANSEVSKLARILEEGLGFGASFVCYSGTAKPLVADGLKLAVRLGFSRIVVAPFFLFTGILVKRIYSAVTALAVRHPEIEFLKCEYLGIHELLADALLERAEESVSGRTIANCSLCKYRVQIIGYEKEVGAPQRGHHYHVTSAAQRIVTPGAHPESRAGRPCHRLRRTVICRIRLNRKVFGLSMPAAIGLQSRSRSGIS